MHNLEELKVWHKSLLVTKEVYQVTKDFPGYEQLGLTNQSRRAAVSISSNIAEGAGRDSNKEFSHFLSIANGSSYELFTQMKIANGLTYINNESFQDISDKIIELQKMIRGLKVSLSKV